MINFLIENHSAALRNGFLISEGAISCFGKLFGHIVGMIHRNGVQKTVWEAVLAVGTVLATNGSEH
jgi:ribulose kinase